MDLTSEDLTSTTWYHELLCWCAGCSWPTQGWRIPVHGLSVCLQAGEEEEERDGAGGLLANYRPRRRGARPREKSHPPTLVRRCLKSRGFEYPRPSAAR